MSPQTDSVGEVAVGGVKEHLCADGVEQPLFERAARGVNLNEVGTLALPHLSEGFAAIGRASVALRLQRPNISTLRIAALPALAQLWVVPRLAIIRSMYPGVDISVHANDTPPNLDSEPFDAAIYFAPATGKPNDLPSDELTPVAAPSLAQRLFTPNDLDQHNLIHDQTWRDHWPTWLTAAGVAQIKPAGGASFTLYAMAIDAARNGDGVLLGRRSLVARYLEDGSLVAPIDLWVPTGDSVQITLRDPVEPGLEALLSLLPAPSSAHSSVGEVTIGVTD